MIDDSRLDELIAQLPNAFAILERVKAKFGFGIRGANIQFETGPAEKQTSVRKIRKLEKYLRCNDLINETRPRRMPHWLNDDKNFWWVKETFHARKVIVPTPVLLEKFGVIALTFWISDPKRISRPKKAFDWVGSFLYLPTLHFDKGRTSNVISGCSALQFVANVCGNKPIFEIDGDEPLGRGSRQHPIKKLERLGAFVSDERKLESLYYVRYITNEQVYSPNGIPLRVNDVVGYPIYISAYPPTSQALARRLRPIEIPQGNDDWFHGDPDAPID
jgi:hypothetical protein